MAHYLKKELYELIKKDESIFDFIQEGSLDGLWYWDLENPENEWMNPRFWEVLGYNPVEMPHKASAWQDIINQDDLKRALDNFQKHVADPSHPYDQIVRYTHKNGSTVWVRCRGLAIRDKKGKAVRMLGAHQDITNIKNTEEKLQQEHQKVKKNEEMYRFLTENGTDVIRYQSPTGIFNYISPNIVELTGYTATEYSKFGPLENVFPEDHPILEQIVERFSKGENAVKVEYRIHHKTGEVIWVESRIKAVRDENGETTSLLSSTNNITEQKKLQIEVGASEEKYKATYNNAPLAFQSLDFNGNILEVNPQWLKILNYPKEEVIGKWFGDFLHPDYVAHFRKNFPRFKAQGYINNVQFQMKRKNKEFIYVSFEGCIGYTPEGEFKQTYCTFKDITEQKLVEQKLKQSESRYKQLVETSSDAIYLMDEEGIIIDTNKTATKILKKERDEIVGKPIDTVDPNYPIGDFIAYWKTVPYGEQHILETTHITSTGELIPIEISGKKFELEGNTYYYGVARDITERKISEELIQKQIQEYQTLNEEYLTINEELSATNKELKDAFKKVEASQRKFKSYINYAPDGVFVADEKGRYLEANPAASRITGYTNEELLQLSIPDLLQKDDIEIGTQNFKKVQKEGLSKIDLGFVTKSGENRYWQVAAVKLSETRFLGFVKDITEQKHAERKIKESLNLLNSFINNFPDDAWAKDLEGKMTLANRFVKDNTFGCEDVIGKTAYDFFPQKIAEECWTSEKDVLLNDKSIQIEEQIPQRDGVHSKILSKFPLHNSDGNVIGIGAIAHDITDRKKAEEALKQSEQKFISYFNSNPSATFVWKIVQNDFELIEVNETAQGITANKAISFIGLKASQIYKDNPVILQKFLECAKTKTIIDYENKYKNQSLGTVNWLRFRFSFVEPDLILLYSDNITDRKEAERKIKEQNEEYEALNEELRQTNEELFATIRREEEINERFKLAMEVTSDGLMDWNLISNEIYYSPRWKSLLGYEDHELPNDFSVWEKLTDSEDVKKSWNMLNQLINREIDKFDIEFKMQHKEGHWVDIHSRANVFFNNEEKAIRVVGTHTDITQRKNAEKIIRESEEKLQLSDSRYRKAEEIGKVGNWEYNIEKDAFWASDESKRIFGIDMGQGSFTNEEVESCIPERERVHRALIDLIEQEKPYNLEFEIIAHDTAERKTITSIAELIKDKNGKPLSVVGVIQDISTRKLAETKLKENEEKLRLSIDNSPLGICTNDIEGNFISTNAAYEQLVGYTKEELKQMSFYDITHPDYLDKNKELFHAMAANIKPGFHLEKKYIRKDGSTVDVRVYATTVVDANKKPLFGMAFTEDITWQKVAENDLIEAKEKAEEANRLKTEFLHNMSHEIRTPMNGIMGFSNLLCELDDCNDVQKNYTAIIQNSSTQLLRIIDDILEISTLETKQLKVKEEEFDVNQFIMELFAIYDLKSKERHLPLYAQKELPNGFSSIRSDRTKLHKILSNLLDNAFKFTTSGKIEFGYKIENQNIVFFVKDTGIGISSDKQLKVFERFSQESSLTAQAFGGLGLGLSIAKENAELLNGKLTVESEKNKGAAFFVEIPFKPAKETALYRASEADSKREKKDIVHILIAEDEEVNYLYLETILENTDAFSVKLHHAINGEEAVNKCLNDVIDIVLMDIKMPVMNGYLAAEKIKAVKPELPIIAQTAYSTISEKEMALKYGCDDFISKPIKKEELFLMMMKYLNK